MRFPSVLIPLCEKIKLNLPENVKSCPFFSNNNNNNGINNINNTNDTANDDNDRWYNGQVEPAVQLLTTLYIERSYNCWIIPETQVCVCFH